MAGKITTNELSSSVTQQLTDVNTHKQGVSVTQTGQYANAEGDHTTASSESAHAEGSYTTASGEWSHAEGFHTTSSGLASHSEGYSTEATGDYSHAEGDSTTASGEASHAEGIGNTASGDYSHTQNSNTIAQGYAQTVIGEYNTPQGTATSRSNTDYAFIIGNGSAGATSNALTVDWQGNATAKDFITKDGKSFVSHLADNASEADPGHIEIATLAEILVGADALRAITPSGLKGASFTLGTNSNVVLVTDDLNNYVTPGNYHFLSSSTDAGNIGNVPKAEVFLLFVIKRASNIIHQIWIGSNTGVIYFRKQLSGAWDPWKATYSENNKPKAADVGAITLINDHIAIPSGANLDNYKTAGNYMVPDVATANTLINYPASEGAVVTVSHFYSTTTVLQRVVTTGLGTIYHRRYNGGSWDAWKMSYNTLNATVSTVAPGSALAEGFQHQVY